MQRLEDTNIAIVHRFVEAENRHDIDAIAALMADGCEFYGNGTLVAPTWSAYRPIMAATFAAFPESHRAISQVAAQGDSLPSAGWSRELTRGHGTDSRPPASQSFSTAPVGSGLPTVESRPPGSIWTWRGPVRQMTGG